MDLVRLQRELEDLVASLFHEGVLNEQFEQIQKLQDDEFTVEVVSLFLEDAERLINELTVALNNPPQFVDYRKIDANVHQLKGCSSSIGAARIANVCVLFRKFCEEYNLDSCGKCLHQLKYDFSILKTKLEQLLRLEQQIIAAGGSESRASDVDPW